MLMLMVYLELTTWERDEDSVDPDQFFEEVTDTRGQLHWRDKAVDVGNG